MRTHSKLIKREKSQYIFLGYADCKKERKKEEKKRYLPRAVFSSVCKTYKERKIVKKFMDSSRPQISRELFKRERAMETTELEREKEYT